MRHVRSHGYSNPPGKRHSIFGNNFDKMKETTFVAVPCIKEINTSKFNRVYYLEGLPGIVNSLPGN